MAEFFEGAGQSEGLEVWRIEDMKPVKLPITQHGKFHEGDSYLVMNVSTLDTIAQDFIAEEYCTFDTIVSIILDSKERMGYPLLDRK